jgi:transglutaminase-like putative cysteine protease
VRTGEPWLLPTRLINSTHQSIVDQALLLTRPASSIADAATRIHNFVRDEIRFGFGSRFYATPASEVLSARIGYCNSKASLFLALLRAAGIPSRLRMMEISSDVLQGLVSPGTASVDHGVSEVWIDARWITVDSYVVDAPLVRRARERLAASGSPLGWGIHVRGSVDWSARSDAFIQCVRDRLTPSHVVRDHGVFADALDFYERVSAARNRLTFGTSIALALTVRSINRRIDAVRRGAL